MVLSIEALVYSLSGLVMAVMFFRRARSASSRLNKAALAACAIGLFASARMVTTAASSNTVYAIGNQIFSLGLALIMINLFREAWRSPQ